MSQDLILRETSPGRWIVGRPYVRDGTLHVVGRTRWASGVEDAVRIVQGLTGATDTPGGAEASETDGATHQSRPFDYRPTLLKPQARKVIRLMKNRGGLTSREAQDLGIGRLSARIGEIRSVYGDDAVPKTWEKTRDGRRYARYHWRGPDAVQLEIGDAA